MSKLPIWLNGRDRAIAEALIANGFGYYGCPHDPERLFAPETVGDWTISPACQEPAIEVCHHYGALFRKEYAEDYSNLDNSEYERVRELIAQTQLACDNKLPGVANA